MKFFTITMMIALVAIVGCARLDHVQIGDIDNTLEGKKHHFSIKVSETGIDVKSATRLAQILAKDSQIKEDLGNIGEIISLFQMGPRTGNPVYNDTYAEDLIHLIYDECPSGKITGITAVREARAYPVISGEIVNISGYCLN